MSPSSQVSAAAASDAYIDRDPTQIDKWPIKLDGQKYQVLGYRDDPATGFHATAYQNIKTNEIIIAYRGTDPDFKHHNRTTFQDALVDATMVKDKINPQKSAADAFTQEVLKKAAELGIPKDHVTTAGHSLGGTLAEIEAAQNSLHGTPSMPTARQTWGYGSRTIETTLTNLFLHLQHEYNASLVDAPMQRAA